MWMWMRRRRGVRAGYFVVLAAFFLANGATQSSGSRLAVGAVVAGGCLALGVFEWFRPARPARGPLHPPDKSTIQWFRNRRRERKDK
jgi:hypothetical protein